MRRCVLERELRSLGWFVLRHGRKYDVWSDGRKDLAVPRHREINEHTASAILREAARDVR